jgi:hypothetical protein
MENRLPEIHAWAGIPKTNELLDFTTKHWVQAAIDKGHQWPGRKPPDYLWANNETFPEGVFYHPYAEATGVAIALLRALRSGVLILPLR